MTPLSATNPLANFVLNTSDDWKKNRKPLELRWNKNLNAFKNISDGVWKKGEGEDWRSDAFIGKTKQKCIALYSIIVNILLRDGKFPFLMGDANEFSEGTPEDQQEEDFAKGMQKLIDRQTQITEAGRVLMKNILCACVIGEAWQKKGITSKTKKSYQPIAVPEGVEIPPDSLAAQQFELIVESIDYPNIEYISPYNILRDLEGDSGIIHYDYVSPFWLRSQIGTEYFDEAAIEKVIKEYAGTSTTTDDNPSPAMKEVSKRRKTIPYREFWGRAPKKLVMDHEQKIQSSPANDTYDNDGKEIECMICVAGSEIVRYYRTDDPSERPFENCVLQEDIEGIGGLGVPDNTNDKQLVLNGAARSFIDNKALSGNVILATHERKIEGKFSGSVTPGMNIPLSEECKDAREAIQSVTIPDVGASLLDLIAVVERWFDEDSNIPKISQGIQTNGQQTAYEMSKVVDSSGKYVGGILHNFDKLIKADAEYYYHYNMMDPNCKVKGNFAVKPLGYIEYQNSFERIQALNQIFGVVQMVSAITQNPQMNKEIRGTSIIEQACRATKVDPDEFIITQKEREAYAQSPAGQAEAAAIQLAEQQKQEVYQLEKQAKLAEIKKYEAEAQLAVTRALNETTLAKSHAAATIGKIQNQQDQIKIQEGKKPQDVVSKPSNNPGDTQPVA